MYTKGIFFTRACLFLLYEMLSFQIYLVRTSVLDKLIESKYNLCRTAFHAAADK